MIRRRQVFYVEGYDPQGAVGYNRLFMREMKRFLTNWPVEAKVSELVLDSDDLAHWTIETAGPNWQVVTRYEFLRLERLLSANLAQPIWRQMFRAFRWTFDDHFSGAYLRIVRASWRFAVHVAYPQVMLILWVALSCACGVLAARGVNWLVAWPAVVVVALGTAVAVAVFIALIPLVERWLVMRVANGWPYLREFARGAPSAYDHPVEVYAKRIVAAAQAAEADEIVVMGHSAGGVTGIAVMARALELDPDLGRHGPRVVYLSVGSLLPAFALHPAAARIREAIRRLAIEPAVLWVDAQSRKDVMNFYDIDPVEGVGVKAGAERQNPLVWKVRFHDMLSAEVYRRFRINYFRIHYQWIMANSMRAPYDYFMLMCGPVLVEHWARRQRAVLSAFSEDATYMPPRMGWWPLPGV